MGASYTDHLAPEQQSSNANYIVQNAKFWQGKTLVN